MARAILAIALAYVLVLKVVFAPFAAGHQPGYGVPGLALVICSAHEGARVPATPDGGSHSSCCDEGCVQRILSLAAPLLGLFAILFGAAPAMEVMAASIGRRVARPPWRVASSPGAQRAPPFALV